MPRLRRLATRPTGPVGVAITAWEVWRRIPKRYRRVILRQARVYGVVAVKTAIEYQRRRKPKR